MNHVPSLPDLFEPPPEGGVDVLVIAGEHSGDEHAAVVIKNLLDENPALKISAIGGNHLKEAGAQLLFDLTDVSLIGFVEVLRHYGFFKSLFYKTLRWVTEYKPKTILFIDYPGFNLRLAEKLHDQGLSHKSGGPVKLLFYISPQVWAWKQKRKYKMAEYLDALSVIFPFEVECFSDTKLPTQFVGHPFVQGKQDWGLQYDQEGKVLLLPGSRVSAVRNIFPVLIEAFILFHEKHPEREACVIYPSETIRRELDIMLRKYSNVRPWITLAPNNGVTKVAGVLTSSGTMSLRCALAGIPGRVVYKANIVTVWMAKLFMKIPYIGIANILLDKPYYPEFLQGAANAKALANELEVCLFDEASIQRTLEDSVALNDLLSIDSKNTPWSWLAGYLT